MIIPCFALPCFVWLIRSDRRPSPPARLQLAPPSHTPEPSSVSVFYLPLFLLSFLALNTTYLPPSRPSFRCFPFRFFPSFFSFPSFPSVVFHPLSLGAFLLISCLHYYLIPSLSTLSPSFPLFSFRYFPSVLFLLISCLHHHLLASLSALHHTLFCLSGCPPFPS